VKKMKYARLKANKIIFILLGLALLIVLFSCTGADKCKNHTDNNDDNMCDNCGEAIKEAQDGAVTLSW